MTEDDQTDDLMALHSGFRAAAPLPAPGEATGQSIMGNKSSNSNSTSTSSGGENASLNDGYMQMCVNSQRSTSFSSVETTEKSCPDDLQGASPQVVVERTSIPDSELSVPSEISHDRSPLKQAISMEPPFATTFSPPTVPAKSCVRSSVEHPAAGTVKILENDDEWVAPSVREQTQTPARGTALTRHGQPRKTPSVQGSGGPDDPISIADETYTYETQQVKDAKLTEGSPVYAPYPGDHPESDSKFSNRCAQRFWIARYTSWCLTLPRWIRQVTIGDR